MFGDSDIDSLTNHLASISRENQQHHDNLQDLLDRFKNLLDDYSFLKSDYEEVKEGREKYKKQARGQERNPFVLVLVDGDGYIFKDHYIKTGSDGGINAARELSDSVRELMHSSMGVQAEQCRIMVRVYANVLGLSKTLARAGLVGHEARSLSPFISSFNRAQDLFDFVDAAEKKEGSDFKIREMFRLFVDLNQCRQIYFAGCHDTGYGSLLTPYRGKSDRITLIKGASFHRDFEALGLPIRELPSVFSSTPLVGTKPTTPVSSKPTAPLSSKPNLQVSTSNATKPVCKYFQKGLCKFGNTCNKQHIMPTQQVSQNNDSPSSLWSSSPVVGRTEEFLSTMLPSKSLKSEEFIPINKDGERLDTYSAPPSSQALYEYQRRAKQHKVCNKYHLSGECGDMSCMYDHTDVSDTIIEVLNYMVLQMPCTRLGNCRSIKCYKGHLCQKPGCKAVKNYACRFNHRAHTLDLQVAQWVAPLEQIEAETENLSLSDGSLGDSSADSFHFS